MKKERKQELKSKTKRELNQFITEAEKELARMKLETATGKIEDSHAVYKKRKEIAVAKTILTEQNKEKKKKNVLRALL